VALTETNVNMTDEGAPRVDVAFINNLPAAVGGTLYCVLYNSAHQVGGVSSGKVLLPMNSQIISGVPVSGLPSGVYTAEIFLISPSGVVLSQTYEIRVDVNR